MTRTLDADTVLADSCIAVLKRIETPLSCVALSRLCHADSSVIFRVLSNHPAILAKRGPGLTVFSVKP